MVEEELSTRLPVGLLRGPIGVPGPKPISVKRFNYKSFKKFIEKYDPIKNAGNHSETVLLDMLYGLGLALDKNNKGSDAFNQFKVGLALFLLSR